MGERHRPLRRPGTPRQRLIAESSDEELQCWIGARDAVEVLVAIAAARHAVMVRAAAKGDGG